MDLKSLRIFRAVAQTGGVSSAAQKLNYVQSNVTAQIKKLEEELGVILFMREKRGMFLTAQGKLLLDYADRLLELEAQALRVVRGSVLDGGALSIGAMETATATRLPSMIKNFHRDFKGTQISVRTGTSSDLVEQVLHHKLDLAIVGLEVDHPDLEKSLFSEEELVLVQNKDQTGTDTFLMFREGCAYRVRAEQWLREVGHIGYQVMEFGTLEGILGCVDAGVGRTILPKSALRNVAFDFDYQVLPPHIAAVKTYYVYHKKTPHTEPLKKFLTLTPLQMDLDAA